MSANVVVVGAGVAGLSAAHRLLRDDPSLDVTVLETAEDVGGRLTTVEVGDLELDAGPDSFVARKPWAADLCRELGLGLVEPGASGAYVWTGRGLVPMPATALGVPADLDELARWPGLTRRARLRALSELVRKARPAGGDEALGALLRRRLGDDTTQALVAPLLAGLFAGDVDELGVAATFPELASWERTFGSLIRGARGALRASATAGPLFVRPAERLPALPAALAAAIGPSRIRRGTRATSIRDDGTRRVVSASAGDAEGTHVVLATPAFEAAALLEALAPVAAERLRRIRYVSTAVVLLVYPEGSNEGLPDATGFVVPAGRAPMTAATFLSRKWPEAVFGSRAVLRCFVGAAGSEDLLEAEDRDIVEAVTRHLAALLPLPARAQASAVVRWPRSMPQYGVGHLELVREIEEALPPGIFVIGNAYGGVGVADTVRGANAVADRVRGHPAGATEEAESVR